MIVDGSGDKGDPPPQLTQFEREFTAARELAAAVESKVFFWLFLSIASMCLFA
jgi:hypothetical protein